MEIPIFGDRLLTQIRKETYITDTTTTFALRQGHDRFSDIDMLL